jgi:hypothetical protein
MKVKVSTMKVHSSRELALMQMTLDSYNIDYYPVSHEGYGGLKAIRLFVEKRDEHWMKEHIAEVEKRIASGELATQFDYELTKYDKQLLPTS